MKDNIKREDLKSNFLKTTVLRLDYDYLFEEDVEQIIKQLNTFLIKKGYKMNSKTLSETKIGFNMQKNNNDEDYVNINKKAKEQASSFINKDKNIILDITRNFSTMSINYKYNKPFEDIVEVFNEVIKQVKKVREKISLNRIGLKKTNMYFLTNIDNINKYFEEKLFSFNNLILNRDVIIKQQLESFFYDNFKVIQNSEIQIGTYINKDKQTEEQIYRILLDIDIYDDKLDDNEIDLNRMNLDVFEIYKSNLKIDFLEELKKEEYKNEELFKLW